MSATDFPCRWPQDIPKTAAELQYLEDVFRCASANGCDDRERCGRAAVNRMVREGYLPARFS